MNETSFQSFITLVELGSENRSLAQEAEQFETSKSLICSDQIAAYSRQTAGAYQKAHTLRKSVDALELELKALVRCAKTESLSLGLASSPKEFFSLESEIKDIEEKHALKPMIMVLTLINELRASAKSL